MEPFVAVRDVVRRFGRVVAVDGATLNVERGKLAALLGPSGCGKTTLLRLIGGLDHPDEGTISLDGRVLSGPGVFVPPERREVVMVFQDFALFPHMDVAKNVAFGFHGEGDKKTRVNELLEMVGLGGLQRRMPHELSGGQQQRVALARALAAEPRLILLDEPFSNLDPSVRVHVREEVRQLIREIGITAVFVTHDQDEALSMADEVAVMIDGKVLQSGSPHTIYRNPASRAVAEFVGHPNFLPGTVADGVAVCELGSFPVSAPPGPADIMVRSEDVAPAEAGTCVEVIENVYFGHEQLLTLRLPSGAVLRSRWRGPDPILAGQRIAIAVTGDVLAFGRA